MQARKTCKMQVMHSVIPSICNPLTHRDFQFPVLNLKITLALKQMSYCEGRMKKQQCFCLAFNLNS